MKVLKEKKFKACIMKMMDCILQSGCDYVVGKREQRETEVVVLLVFKLCSGGCWVILSFTHALVRVSRSGGTVSMADRRHMAKKIRLIIDAGALISIE